MLPHLTCKTIRTMAFILNQWGSYGIQYSLHIFGVNSFSHQKKIDGILTQL